MSDLTPLFGDGAENRKERVPGRPFMPGQSGNPGGRPKGLEKLAREIVGDGHDLVQFYRAVFDGQPFRVGKKLVYPTLDQRLEAAMRLEVRGWGKPKQEVVVDEGETRGFTIVHRRWAPGVDPLANQERVIEANGRALPAGPTATEPADERAVGRPPV